MSTNDKHLRLISLSSGFKFDPANGFGQWKLKVDSILTAYGYDDVLDEEIIPQTKSSRKSFGPLLGAVDTGSWSSSKGKKKKKDDKDEEDSDSCSSSSSSSQTTTVNKEQRSHTVFTFILLCLMPEQLKLVQHITKGDAHGLWKVLVNHYERKTLASKLHLRKQFSTIKMEGNESFETYVARFSRLVMQLNDDGEEIGPTTVLATLLHGLPDEYESVIDAISWNKDITFEEACSFIKDKQDRITSKKGTTSAAYHVSDAARAAKGGGGNRHPNHHKKQHKKDGDRPKVCFTCKKSGHTAYECSRNKDKVKCDNCRWVGGHSTAQCTKPARNGNHDNKPSNSSNNNNNNSSSSTNANNSNTGAANQVHEAAHAAQVVQLRNQLAALDPYHDNPNRQYSFILSAINNSDSRCSTSHELVLDSGATRHMVNDRNLLSNIRAVDTVDVITANNTVMQIREVGDISLVNRNNESNTVIIKDVGLIPTLAANLISGIKMTDAGFKVSMDGTDAVITKDGNTVLTFVKDRNLYRLPLCPVNKNTNKDSCYAVEDPIQVLDKQQLLHCRMGHASPAALAALIKHGMVEDIESIPIDVKSDHVCNGCITGKAHRVPFGKNKFNRSNAIMDCLHVDLCGPVFGVNNKETSIEAVEDGDNHFMIAIDEYSRKKWCETFKYKSGATDHLINLINRLEVESGKPLKELHTDGGKEFQSTRFIDYCKSKGIRITITTPYTPQDNPLSERGNRTILERVRPALHHARLSGKFWADATKAMCYVSNRLSTSSIKSMLTPEEVWSGVKPSIKHIKVFGCNAFVHVRKEERGKLDSKTTKAIYLRYNEQQHGYLVFDIENKKRITSRDVTFDEYSFTHAKEYTDLISDAGESFGDIGEFNELFDNEVELAKIISREPAAVVTADASSTAAQPTPPQQPIKKVRWKQDGMISEINPAKNIIDKPRARGAAKYYGMVNYKKEIGVDQSYLLIEVPRSYEEAMKSKHHSQWKVAMDREMKSLIDNDVFQLVPMPTDGKTNIMGCRWVFKIKFTSEGEIERFKARMVGQGYTQVFGIDYNETFAPVAKYKSLRILIAIATNKGYEMKQLDVETAFLYADVKEDIYMKQPKGYETGGANMVWKLKKALYGIKQAPHEWNNEINNFIVIVLLFTRCKSDTCMYTRMSQTGRIMIISIFVDDIVCAFHPEDSDEWVQIKQQIVLKYKIRDLGDIQFILGMKIIRDRATKSLIVNHERYINDMLVKFGMEHSSTNDTPELTTKFDISKASGQAADVKLYQSIVGALLYTSISVRADISHAVNILSRYLQAPLHEHLVAAKRVLRYLKGTAAIGLRYGSTGEIVTSAYCDADWAGDVSDRKSQTGYVVKVGNNTVIWNSSKQKTTSLSTAEAEYMAVSAVVQEVTWVNSLLRELSFTQTTPTQIYCDNQAAIYICNNDSLHSRTKHIDIRHHYIRDEIKNKAIAISYVESAKQQADIFTKALGKQVFIPLRDSIM
jgi:hypothetical protein